MNDPTCNVCEHPARQIIEQFLFIGYAYPEIPKEVGEPNEFANEIRNHHFQRHVDVESITPDAYAFMIVRYVQDVRKVEKRELEKSPERQLETRLKRCDEGKRWAIDRIGRLRGFDKLDSRTRKTAREVLADLIKAQPKLESRVKAVTTENAEG